MSLFKKALWVVVLTSGSFLCVLSCQRDSSTGGLKNRPKEGEIKYFFPTGYYDLNIYTLSAYYDMDGYHYVFPEDIEGQNIIDSKGKILSLLDIGNMFEKAESGFEEDEGDIYYRTKSNVYEYKMIEERYVLGRTRVTYYCKKAKPIAVPKDLILDDNFLVRLYDKNNKIIDEYKMRNLVATEDYKRDPLGYQNKITDSRTDARLIGMLKLPSKNKRKGLKYRVLRLDKNGNPKPYLYPGAIKEPYQYYLMEQSLPPYSEYKRWRYNAESGCYY